VEPLGAVARRGLGSRAGYEPLRETKPTSGGRGWPQSYAERETFQGVRKVAGFESAASALSTFLNALRI
jgi:hypothetical protein